VGFSVAIKPLSDALYIGFAVKLDATIGIERNGLNIQVLDCVSYFELSETKLLDDDVNRLVAIAYWHGRLLQADGW
jgi:hypothetical protein